MCPRANMGVSARLSSYGQTPVSRESAEEISETDDESQMLLASGLPPFPNAQFAVLCLLRTLDPLNFTQIFPYINELVRDLGVAHDPAQIGYYSGLVECVFALAQLIAIYPWGVLSDTVGRRPAILAGAAGLAVTTLIFGLSRDFNSILISRCLAGLFSGNVAVIPSVLCEITDNSNQVFAYPFFGIFWPIGAILGPMIGGSLSHPTEKYPLLFNYLFFKKYPYFLPCCVIACFSVLGFISCYFFLKEVLLVSLLFKLISEERYTVRQLMNIPIIQAICASACALSFISTTFEVIFVLFCYSPIEHGGLGFSPQEIGFALAVSGMGAALLSALIMPKILAQYNHARLYHFGMKFWAIPFLSLPALNLIMKMGLEPGVSKSGPFTIIQVWVGLVIVLAFVRVASLGFSINMLLVKAFVPSPAALGATYSLVQFLICLPRALSPVFASSLYVLSHKYALLGGNSWVLVLAGFSWVAYLLSRRVVYYACVD
ncbi:MFS general substrate transporter [Macrolepiota fuliginosa MF-IS2]|uniref:MFS general substrate transporter n=1 Tax=Macrolepiota fuliginosa MF-IS2 TaxID=1400762 RepID=A0A9P6C670_9AGAR|nr:MFS general substrate transporter [Macrolepiota fuliginosa MF-IS2]